MSKFEKFTQSVEEVPYKVWDFVRDSGCLPVLYVAGLILGIGHLMSNEDIRSNIQDLIVDVRASMESAYPNSMDPTFNPVDTSRFEDSQLPND